MPYANNHDDQPEADGKRHGRKRVGEPIESARGRRRERRFAILLHESLQNRLVRFAARDALVDFLEFGFGDFARARKCRAGMAARACGIAAAASAHELLADRVSAVGGLHGGLGEEGRGEEGGYQQDENRKADSSSRADCAKCRIRDALLGMTACRWLGEERFFGAPLLRMTIRAVHLRSVNHGRRSAAQARAKEKTAARPAKVRLRCAAPAWAGGSAPAPAKCRSP